LHIVNPHICIIVSLQCIIDTPPQAEEQAAPDITATLQAMHTFSSSIDAPQLLQLMAAADEPSNAKLRELHQQASQLVQQLEVQLQQHATEPVVAQWLRASGYDAFALMLRSGEFLAGVKDVQAAKQLAELVRVSCCVITVLCDMCCVTWGCAAAGVRPSWLLACMLFAVLLWQLGLL
jgi:hypothetical protein